MSNGIIGDGRCVECPDGFWDCPPDGQKACESGGGTGPEFMQIGKVWLPLDCYRDHGFLIEVQVATPDGGELSVPFRVHVKAHPVIRESLRGKCGGRPMIIPERWKQDWMEMYAQRQAWEREFNVLPDDGDPDGGEPTA